MPDRGLEYRRSHIDGTLYQTVRGAPEQPENVISLLRTRLGWTQAQLGYWFGVNNLTIQRWERGHQAPPALHARIAWVLLEAKDPAPLLRSLGPEYAT